MLDKSKLRTKLLKKRASLSSLQVQSNSKEVIKKLIDQIVWTKIKNINVYQTIKINNEVDVRGLLEFLDQNYPVVSLDTTSSKITAMQNISEGKTYDLVVVPLLGFDRSGNRLGYGGGYYDKFLSRNKCKQAIGLGYSFQEVKNLPVEKHDQKLDLIITEREIIKP